MAGDMAVSVGREGTVLLAPPGRLLVRNSTIHLTTGDWHFYLSYGVKAWGFIVVSVSACSLIHITTLVRVCCRF